MSLIASISGIRGTIGGNIGENLTPIDLVSFTLAFANWIKQNSNSQNPEKKICLVLGRDGRFSGNAYYKLVAGAIQSCGISVLDIGKTTTPTLGFAIRDQNLTGGIMLSASHNPIGWNALKLFDFTGEYLDQKAGNQVLNFYKNKNFSLVSELEFGSYIDSYTFHPNPQNQNELINKDSHFEYFSTKHVHTIVNHVLVKPEAIHLRNFKIVLDSRNSSGKLIVHKLLILLGVKEENIFHVNGTNDGIFEENPEPLPENLSNAISKIIETKADLAIVVDPDADRLVFIREDGIPFGEEYTLAAVTDYILENVEQISTIKNMFDNNIYNKTVVSNLSSSMVLRDVAQKHGFKYVSSAVGELNVIGTMKQEKSIIGGEGNGGVIFADIHYNRDAMVGIAMVLSFLALTNLKLSELKKRYKQYFMVKQKMTISEKIINKIPERLKKEFKNQKEVEINLIDGIKISYPDEWVHIRRSNTEPIVRIYTESTSESKANALAEKMIETLEIICKNN